MKHSQLIVFLSVFFTFSACQSKTEQQTKLNFLIILADDYGYHDLSITGSKFYETPNIDRIATEGMIFTDGYSTCQVCSPSRASIMSGKYPARHGITDWIGASTGENWRNAGRFNQLLPPENRENLPHEYVTLPEAMKEAGYKTFFAGKWHLGSEGSWPEDHGFDINKGGWDKGSPMGGYFAPWENPNLESGPDGENLTMRLARETVNFMKENKDTSFFAFSRFMPFIAPLKQRMKNGQNTGKKPKTWELRKPVSKWGIFFPFVRYRTIRFMPGWLNRWTMQLAKF
jgi:arylsulfatase A-like enzyme